MIFPENIEQKLGFDVIRQRIRSYCLSDAGGQWVDRMKFSVDAEFIRILLRQSLEFRQILEKSENFPSRFFFDGSEWIARISLAGSYLDAEDFIRLANALDTVLASTAFLSKARDVYPQLYKLSEPV